MIFNLILIVVFFGFNPQALANNIESINIEATIQDDGSVIIKDHRIFNVDEGTEHFISLSNLADSEIEYVKVFENGQEYEFLDNWNIHWSRERKAGKVGIYHNNGNQEISFGVGEYGTKDMIIEYKITNFVKNLEDDYQALYWQFINKDMEENKDISLSIKNEVGLVYQYDETRFWGFGHANGQVLIKTDDLSIKATNGVSPNEYIVGLAIMPANTFNASSNLEMTSEDLIDQALLGAVLNDDESNDLLFNVQGAKTGFWTKLKNIFSDLFTVIIAFIVFASILSAIVAVLVGRKQLKHIKSKVGKRHYYRQAPYMGDFANLDYFNRESAGNIHSAYILKWITKDYLEAEKALDEDGEETQKYKLLLDNSEARLVSDRMDEKEREIWNIFIGARDRNGYITEESVDEAIKESAIKLRQWYSNINDKSKAYLIRYDYMNVEPPRGIIRVPTSIPTPKGQELLDNIKGFKNFLRDFSLIRTRSIDSIDLWNDYLVFAAYLGMADQVYKEMVDLNPSFVTQSKLGNDTPTLTRNFVWNSGFATSSGGGSSSSSSSGGGGSSFSGGGGGSFGGGSGGGSR